MLTVNIEGLGFKVLGFGVRGLAPMMENPMEKKMENEMETGIIEVYMY